MILIRKVLAYFGRQGATGMGVSLLVAAVFPLVVPGLGVAVRPWLPAMIMIFLINAFARVDISHAQRIVARPYKLLCGLGWTVLVVPIVFWVALSLVGRDNLDRGLVLALSLQAAAAPIMATPAVAMVLELKVTFSVVLLLATMAVQPFTAPFVATWVAGTLVPIDGFLLGRNLLLMIGSSTVVSIALRWLVGLSRLEEYRFEITGANLIVFTLFGLAMFDGVVLRVFTQPLLLLSLSALAFLIALGSIAAAIIFLRPIGGDNAFMTGFAAGHRNVGLMAAAQSGSLPDLAWLYFALVQLPIYLTPLLLGGTMTVARQKSGQQPKSTPPRFGRTLDESSGGDSK
jgi:BASS family bile acid:Na+ symporter